MTVVDVVAACRDVAVRRRVTRQVPVFRVTKVVARTLHAPVVDHERRPVESVVITFDMSIFDPAGTAWATQVMVGALTPPLADAVASKAPKETKEKARTAANIRNTRPRTR